MATASSDRIPTSMMSTWWNTLLDITDGNAAALWSLGTTAVVMMVYWTFGGICSIVDITNRPRWLLKYKIQPDQNVPVDKAKYWKAVRQVIFNQVVVTPLFLYVVYLTAIKSRSLQTLHQLPSLTQFLLHIAAMTLMEEPMFYYVHRLLHHRSIYKYIHKKHHEWTSPIAAMTFYCHPVEHIVSNVGPIAISAALLNAHITTAWAFSFLAISNSMADHMGYSFPFPFYKSSVLFHDLHHAKFNYNFGVFGWLDKFHKTFKEHPLERLQMKSNNVNNNQKPKNQKKNK